VTPSFLHVASETARGRTVCRILTYEVLREHMSAVTGRVIDLACGTNPSYRQFLNHAPAGVHLIGLDRKAASRPTVIADLTSQLPIVDGSADAAIVSFYLYIPAEPETLLAEIYRVLRPGGVVLLTLPFVFPYTPEPTDHWRFTEAGIQRLLRKTGLAAESVTPVGGRWTSAAYLLAPFLRPTWLTAVLANWLAIKLDHYTAGLRRLSPCPVAYVVKAHKPA